MANVNLNNENIDIFPISALRPDPTARVLNEMNITGMIRGLTDFPSYVVSKENNYIEFYIQGYHCYIDITKVLEELSNETSIYAILRIDKSSTPVISSSSTNVDNQDPFLGIVFNSTGILKIENHLEYYSLLLLTRSSISASWEVPSSSKVRFKGTVIDTSDFVIDGGFQE